MKVYLLQEWSQANCRNYPIGIVSTKEDAREWSKVDEGRRSYAEFELDVVMVPRELVQP